MPIIAVCPYCHVGRVRAPDRAVGLSYPCPQCHSQFTLSPATAAELAAARSSGTMPHPAPRTPVAADTAMHNAATVHDLPPAAKSSPLAPRAEERTAVVDATADSKGPPLAERVDYTPTPPRSVTDPGLPWALVGLTLAGAGLAASQLPYGRVLTAGLGGAGLVVAGLGVLAADRKKLPPAAACGLSFFAVLIAVAFPGLIGHTGWLPPRAVAAPQGVLSVGHAGGDRVSAEWVDGSQASWQKDDVRVSVRFARVGPVDLVGPKDQKKRTKENLLQIGLRVANVGVARRFEFQGWSATSPDGTAPRLTDSAGKAVSAKRFDPGWEPAGAGPDQKALFPGKNAEYLLVFEPPAKGAEYVRLELPAAAFGGENPVRLQIPTGFIGTR